MLSAKRCRKCFGNIFEVFARKNNYLLYKLLILSHQSINYKQKMKPFISTTTYGVINYLAAISLIASPWLFGFAQYGGAALFMPLLIGWLQLIMAIFSRNPVGFIKVFPMQMHNCLDVLTGSFLLALPWTYDFSSKVYLPHFLFGLLLVVMGVFVQKSPFLTPADRSLPEAGITSIDSSEGRLNN